jgi:Mg-chelatase subunit ChlD
MISAGLLAGCLLAGTAARAQVSAPQRPSVEVVFVLDTTSSMTGMIEGAKQRIWAIANEIAKGRPAPKVRMGLVAYRDKGDAYVTKVVDLSDNLDKTYSELMSFRAEGGGDTPEHVIAGLDDAVEKISWSSDPKTFKVVYLVGDAPPHEDYPEAPTLADVMQKAVRRGLVVNTVSCGGDSQMIAAFTRIARLGEGKLLPVPQNGGMVAVATPFDSELAALSGKLETTGMAFGGGGVRAKAAMDGALSASVRGMASAPAAAERAVFKSRAGFADSDLAQAVADKKVALKDVKEEDLPDDLKNLPAAARQAKLDETIAQRGSLQAKLASVEKRREAFLKKQSGAPRADSFDALLAETLRTEGARKGIVY